MRSLLPSRLRPAEGNTGQLLWTALVIGLASLLLSAVAGFAAFRQVQGHTSWVVHTYEVVNSTVALASVIEESEAIRRGQLLTGDPRFAPLQQAAAAKVDPALERLDELTRDNPEQQARLAQLRSLIDDLRGQQRASAVLLAGGQREAAQALFAQQADAWVNRRIRDVLAAVGAEERTLLDGREIELDQGLTRFYVIVGIGIALFLFVGTVTGVTLWRYTRDLGQVRDALQGVNATLEDTVAERTSELRRANDEIQRFAYIVSHDLRSPLVNVMGFTAELEAGTQAIDGFVAKVEAEAPQLVDDAAREAARTDLPEAIGFIRTSTAKMDRLINAILKLSREGRRTIAPEAIDMAALVGSIRETLQHRLDEQGATITVDGALPQLVSDRVALDQIFSNVIENAVKYRHPDRAGRIVVRGRATGAQAVFEIEDNGRGIDARDHARVFDLFRRSGAQDQPGEGIGLAHVRALTYRLGGTIDVRSSLGEGSTFVITLPLRFSEAPGPKA